MLLLNYILFKKMVKSTYHKLNKCTNIKIQTLIFVTIVTTNKLKRGVFKN